MFQLWNYPSQDLKKLFNSELMLTEKQIEEIKEHLEKAQNPVFLFDNDCDGLCSYLLLRRYIGRGKGVAVRSYPELDVGYAKRISQLKADYIFVLDKPILSKEFFDEIDSMQIPLVWIDHHESKEQEKMAKNYNVYLYNPLMNKGKYKSHEPVTALAYSIVERKEDVWIAVIGCIADHYLPDFADEFNKRYPDFFGKVKEPFEAYYKTEIGRIARAFNFGLKDSISHVVQLQNFLLNSNGPEDVLMEVEGNKSFRETYKRIKDRYDYLIIEAEKNKSEKTIFFTYGGETSMSADLSNELSYKYPDKYIIMAYIKGQMSNVSMRGRKVRMILEKVLKNFPEATGGGHEDAVGARLKTEDLGKFRELFEELLK